MKSASSSELEDILVSGYWEDDDVGGDVGDGCTGGTGGGGGGRGGVRN